jgi:ketosteroid isomerase-like protein
VSQQDVQLVVGALAEAISEDGSVDMIAITGDGAPAQFERVIEPSAEIRFFTAGGGLLGDMTGPFFGLDGFREGWREWAKPFETFTATIESIEDGGEGRVLILVKTRARLRGGGPEVTDRTAAVYVVRDGRIVAIDHYLDQDDARRAAGVPTEREE